MFDWFTKIKQNLDDLGKYGSVGGKEFALEQEEKENKARQEAMKKAQSEEEKENRRLAEQENRFYDYFQKLKKEEMDKIKMEKERLSLFEQIKKIFEVNQPTQAPSVAGATSTESENTPTPTAMPTPTPEQIMEAITKLGIGTTWAINDKPNYPDDLVPYANQAGEQYGIDPLILAAQDAQETGGYNYEPRPGASGERGIPQIIPKWHHQSAGYDDPEVYGSRLEKEPEYAIGEQARILSGYLKGQGNIYDALRQYNAGGVLDNSGTYADEILKRAGLTQFLPGRNI
jgi:hypothetical protein